MAMKPPPYPIEPAVMTTPAALGAMEFRDTHQMLIDPRSNPAVLVAIPSDEFPPPAQRIILIKPGAIGYLPTPFHLPDKHSASVATNAWNACHGYTPMEALDIAIDSIKKGTRAPPMH